MVGSCTVCRWNMVDAHCIRDIYSLLTTQVFPAFPIHHTVSQGHVTVLVRMLWVAVACATSSLKTVRMGMNSPRPLLPCLSNPASHVSNDIAMKYKWWGPLNHSLKRICPWKLPDLQRILCEREINTYVKSLYFEVVCYFSIIQPILNNVYIVRKYCHLLGATD